MDASNNPLGAAEFEALLKPFPFLEAQSSLAVAVSGGPDSMALTCCLTNWAKARRIKIHALTVDHGLRAESAAEAEQVAVWLSGLSHTILRWEGDKPEASVLEEARRARYGLLARFCRENKIKCLFVAHHQDDQAETFLFRLAKGSGLDGLAGMDAIQRCPGAEDVFLVRPFLGIPKPRLIATCESAKISYVMDPSNEKTTYARPRMRKAWGVLEEEGFSAKRLAATASRLLRARRALEDLTEKAYVECRMNETSGAVAMSAAKVLEWPEEISLRILLKAMKSLRDEDYGPRLEKAEQIHDRFRAGRDFRETLGGCLICLKKGVLSVSREVSEKS